MPYITIPIPQKSFQISFEDILNGIQKDYFDKMANKKNTFDTRTVYKQTTPLKLIENLDGVSLIAELVAFMKRHSQLYDIDLRTKYQTFFTEKRHKGFTALFKALYSLQKDGVDLPTSFATKIFWLMKPVKENHPCEKHDEIFETAIGKCFDFVSPYCKVTRNELVTMFEKNFRRIDAPDEDFKGVFYELKEILRHKFFASYHTAAFAYVEGRSHLDAVRRHQENHSRWFLKLDLTNFFGSSTPEFFFNQLKLIYPFNEIMTSEIGHGIVEKALSICFLNGGLPQGTPISPLLTNLMMIPIDFCIAKQMREHTPHIHYTRYADDITLSSDLSFKWTEVQDMIVQILDKFNAPFKINKTKTHYGSSAGRNWTLGVMLNKDNNITIGNQRKKEFKAMLFSLITDYQKGKRWTTKELQTLQGIIAYYRNVEGETILEIIAKYNNRYDVDILNLISQELKAA